MRRHLTALSLAIVAMSARAADDPSALIAAADALPAARSEQASELYERALAGLDPAIDGARWLHAAARKCWLIVHPQPTVALELVGRAAALSSTHGDTLDWHQLGVCGGYAHQRLEQPDAALAAYTAGVAAALAANDLELLSRARVLRGELHYERGAWSDALADLKAAFDASEALGDASGRAYALTAIANLYGSAGEHAKALDYYQQTLALARETGRRDNEATALYNLGVTQDKLGDPGAALEHYRAALVVQRAAGLAADVPDSLRSMAISLIKLDRAGEALGLLDEADALPAVRDDPGMIAALKLTRGAALRTLGRSAEALALLDAARDWFSTTQAAPFLEKIEDERARVLKALGRPAEALAARERQIEIKDSLHQAWRAEQTARLRVEFDTDRFEQQNRALATENALRAAALRDAERIRTLQNGVIVSAGLALVALVGLILLQVRHARRLRRIALTDELTGLPNRRATLDYARRQIERRARERTPVSVVALDIDHFKRINDSFGHDAGDVVLRRVAAALRHFDRGLVGRVGGEEFLAVLPDCDRNRGAEVAESVRRIIEGIDLSDVDPSLRVSSSFGIAEVESGQGWEEAARRADEALYRAKHAGRNRVEICTD